MKPWNIFLIFLILSGPVLVPGCLAPQQATPGPGTLEEPAAPPGDEGPEVTGIFLEGWIGAAFGSYDAARIAPWAETARRYGHGPGKGLLLKIESASVDPAEVTAEGTVALKMTYSVMPPGTDPSVLVTEKRLIVRSDGALVANPRVRVDRTGGTYSSIVRVALPMNVRKGLYSVTCTLETAGASDRMEAAFTVK